MHVPHKLRDMGKGRGFQVAKLGWEEPWMLISSVTKSGTDDLMQKVSLELEILGDEAAAQSLESK